MGGTRRNMCADVRPSVSGHNTLQEATPEPLLKPSHGDMVVIQVHPAGSGSSYQPRVRKVKREVHMSLIDSEKFMDQSLLRLTPDLQLLHDVPVVVV